MPHEEALKGGAGPVAEGVEGAQEPVGARDVPEPAVQGVKGI